MKTVEIKRNFAVISDPHCHNFKEHATMIGDRNSRLMYAIESIRSAIDKCVDLAIGTMFVTGDITHTRGSLKPSVLNAVIEVFSYGVEKGLEFYIISGNHDLENYRYGESAVDALSLIKNVHVFKHPDVEYRPDLGLNILAIPYMNSNEQFRDCYENMVKMHDDINVVLMHQYIDDFTPSVMPDTGITIDWLTSLLPEGSHVLCGHYHEGNMQGANGSYVVNVGSLLSIKFGDEGAYGMTTYYEDDGLDFHQSDTPKFITVDKLPKSNKDLVNLVGGNYIRIMTDTLSKAEKMKTRCEGAGALSVKINIVKDYKVPEKRAVIEISSDEKMVSDFLELDDCGVPKEKRPQVYELFKRVCVAGA